MSRLIMAISILLYWPASYAETPNVRRFDSMSYFTVDPTERPGGNLGLTYVNLIGHLESRNFQLYYQGAASSLMPTHHARKLRVRLMAAGKIVGVVDIADLSRVRGSVLLNRHLPVTSAVAMRDVDKVEVSITP